MSTPIGTYEVTPSEKATFRKNGVRLRDVGSYSVAELKAILNCPDTRAKEIFGIHEFPKVPSIGIRFAEDLVAMGYCSLNQLKTSSGPKLFHQLELLRGYWQDPCVEDQCRLVVYFASTGDGSKKWWDFTAERKEYRAKHGYLADRPQKAWFEMLT